MFLGLGTPYLLPSTLVGRRRLALGIGQRLVDDLVKPLPVDDFNKRHTIRLVGDNPNGRRVLNTNALAEIEICLDFCRQLLLRIDDERKCNAMLLGELLRKITKCSRSGRRRT